MLGLDLVPQTFDDVDVLLLLLDHLHPAPPHLQHGLLHVQHRDLLVGEIVNHLVDGDEGSGPADPGTAVDEDGVKVGVEVTCCSDEISQDLSVVGSSKVGPLDGLQLDDLHRFLVFLLDIDPPESKSSFLVFSLTFLAFRNMCQCRRRTCALDLDLAVSSF